MKIGDTIRFKHSMFYNTGKIRERGKSRYGIDRFLIEVTDQLVWVDVEDVAEYTGSFFTFNRLKGQLPIDNQPELNL